LDAKSIKKLLSFVALLYPFFFPWGTLSFFFAKKKKNEKEVGKPAA